MRFPRNPVLAAVLAASISACGGGAEPPAAEDPAPPAAATLPVQEPTGEIDEELADAGEELFAAKGCVACHTLGGGRLTGPDLTGVTRRRTFAWIYHQIVVPDSMTMHDPTARQLMAEYMTQMPDLGVQPEEALALYEYLREEDTESATEEEPGPVGASLLDSLGRGGLIGAAVACLTAWSALGFAAGLREFADPPGVRRWSRPGTGA